MVKHLIYYNWYLDIRGGGPTGYLANLRYGLDRIPNPEDFEIEIWATKKEEMAIKQKQSWFSKFISGISALNYLNVNYISKDKRRWYDQYVDFLSNIDSQYVQCDVVNKIKKENVKVVHCHQVIDALRVLNTLRKENISDVKVALTSHTPEAPSLENYNIILSMGYSKEKAQKLKKLWQNVEEKAFCMSNILIFPSIEAMEPYFDTIPKFKDWIKNKDIRFFQTGAKSLKTAKTEKSLKEQFCVKKNKNIVVYIGRHEEVKGYNIFVRAGQRMLLKRQDLTFLVGGKINKKIRYPNDENWIELGIVNPAELLKIADVFVLPNKRTYFDLILLEAMSMGVPIIASNTGGNKSVQESTNALIMYDGSLDDFECKLTEFLNRTDDEKKSVGERVICAYKNNYTPELFALRYVELVRKIYRDYNIF